MREDIRLEDWRIWADGPFQDDFLESIFFCGGGRMGVRGYAAGDPRPRPVQQGLFLAGMFDEIKPGITDVIHLPTPVWHHLTVDGEEPAFCGSVRRTLELDKGLLRLEYRLQEAQAALKVTEERFFDPERPALLAQRLTVEPQAPARLRLESGIYSASRNCPVPDDQVKENTETMQLMEEMEPRFEENALTGRWRSRTTCLELRQQLTFRVRGGAVAGSFYRPGEALGLVVEGDGGTLVVEKMAALFTSRDKDPRIASAPEGEGWEELLAAAQRHWARLWQGMDMQVEGDASAQTALRYLAYQLTASCSGKDDTVNIGARGLTHARYKGCYFWDTDLFMLPFFLYTQPASARSLAQYRVNCLPQAKAHAKKMNGAGARYPWMASFDGSEQCESWDIGASEVHITADVAYALDQYLQATGDESFAPGAREVFVETARFWRSRYTAEPGTGRENLLFCKGPDEYCGITSNNLFTGEMVRHNLDLALAADPDLKTLGLIYNLGETNSVTTIENMKPVLEEKGITAVESTVTNAGEVQMAAQNLLAQGAEAIFVPIDNTVADGMAVLATTAIEAGVPVYTAADSLVRDGGLATTGVNYTKLGELTAQMAVDVLNGADPAATPVQVLNDGITTVNTTTAAALGIDPEIFDLTGEGYIAVE